MIELTKLIVSNKMRIISLLNSSGREGINNVVKHLCDSSFFTDPASERYHNAWTGGLADHSLKVYEELKKIAGDIYPEETLILVSLLHDLTKIGSYYQTKAWRKDKNDKWEAYRGYKKHEDLPNLGHGSHSVIIAAELGLKLSDEEKAAILFHMGAFDEGNSWTFTNACIKYPLVIMTHSADMIASFTRETQGVKEEWVMSDSEVKALW